jgi:hypothetical protein
MWGFLYISDGHLGVIIFTKVVEKMSNILQPWKGKNMTSGGRLILTNTSLSSLPTYTRGFTDSKRESIIKWILSGLIFSGRN